MDDNELASLADPSFDQYFLVSPAKLSLIYDAAGIRSTDRVVEIGAGAGTVARSMPLCESLTVVEFDKRLIEHLRKNVPHANVINGDGLSLIREMEFDVLVSNLPNVVTESLIDILPEVTFRATVMAVGEHTDLSRLPAGFEVTEVTTISGTDFRPSQPNVSRIVKVARIST